MWPMWSTYITQLQILGTIIQDTMNRVWGTFRNTICSQSQSYIEHILKAMSKSLEDEVREPCFKEELFPLTSLVLV